MSETGNNASLVWPHRWAVLLACATFPLIWVGGLVTTYEAGMAVPDWPSTYGYNLFLYPWQTWVFGPWDVFIEHGHRLLGAAVGLIAIALVCSVWRGSSSWSLRGATVVALALVIFQGLLGGGRVVMNERLLAMVHGCVGPAFFAFAAVLALCLSRRWREARPTEYPQGQGLRSLAVLTAGLAYTQLVFGALVRHGPRLEEVALFRSAVPMHLALAGILSLHVLWLGVRLWRHLPASAGLRRAAALLVGLLLLQLGLGSATWIVNYGWPTWFSGWDWVQGYTIQRMSFQQAMITTAHVAVGSLIVATSAVVAARVWRQVRSPAWKSHGRLATAGVVAL